MIDPAWLADQPPIAAGVVASLAAGLATGLGALPALLLKRISPRLQSAMLGFAAGVMLAASVFSLIVPGLEIAAREHGGIGAILVVGSAIVLGALGLWLIDEHAPHEHFIAGREGPATASLRRVWLFVIAITLHNFPEGLAVGVGFGAGDPSNAMALALGIGLQNMPEGLAVAFALIGERYGRAQAVGIALLTGLIEPIGGLLGVTAVVVVEPLLPWGLAFAAGSMLFVICGEIIPETHRKGFQKVGTFGIILGFVVMMSLDVTLG